MRGTELLDKLELVDPAYVAEADIPVKKRNHWKRWTALAACLCIAVGAAVWGSRPAEAPPVPVPPAPEAVWERVSWNVVGEEDLYDIVSPNRRFDPGYFERELTAQECAGLLPTGVEGSGRASFNGEGELLGVTLTVSSPSGPVLVLLGGNSQTDCLLPEEYAVSRLGELEVTLWSMEQGEERLLRANLKGQPVAFQLEPLPGVDWNQAQEDFLTTLKPFSVWSEGCPKLELDPGPIPAWFEGELTLQEAMADPAFGPWVLAAPPKGFTLDRCWRYMSQYFGEDLLSQCWTHGLANLDWRVEKFTQEDSLRLVRPEEREKYDMALYSIPYFESVPEALREVVDCPIFEAEELTAEMVKARAYRVEDSGDIGGWRARFAIRYGDVLVTVSMKGVEPDWLYDQLSQLPRV